MYEVSVKRMIEILKKYDEKIRISDTWIGIIEKDIKKQLEEKEAFKEKYKKYLEMPRDQFEEETHLVSFDGGSYHYYPNGGVDSEDARISYLQYLTEKH